MTYTLEISLVGADKAESVLSKLATINQKVASGGLFGGTSSSSSNTPSAQILKDLDKASFKVTGMKKDFQSIATGFAQGMSATGKAWMTTAFTSKSAAFQALNPHLAGIMQGMQAAAIPWKQYGLANLPGINKWALPNVNLPQFAAAYSGAKPPVLGTGSNIQQQLAQIPLLGRYFTAIGAITLAIESFKKAVDTAKDAINKGFGIYSGAAQSGLSAQFYTQRNSLASIFGVSDPREIFMFGKAITDMQQRIAVATQTLANNSPVMAQLHMNLSVMALDFEAFATKIVSEAAPALNLFIGIIDTLIKKISNLASSPIGKFLMFEIGKEVLPLMGLMQGKGDMKNIADFLKPAPALHALMTKLPGSQFEHMGLNIGPGTQTTNDLIRQSNRYLAHLPGIATALGSGGGIPRAPQFGFQGNMNQP